MAAKIVWLNEAVSDLEEIVEYIEARSASYAPVVASKILNEVERLSQFPNIGGLIREDPAGRHRHLICYNYRIIYRVEGDYAFIVTVIHGARELPQATLERRPSLLPP